MQHSITTKTNNMKICIICLMLVLAAGTVQSQPATTTPTPTKQDYLKKSKNQKTAAWLFMVGGGTMIVLGAMDSENTGYSDNTRSAALVVTGIAAVGVSTTLFIASTRNKKKAESMSFKMERAPVLQQNGLAYSSFPVLSFKIKL